MKQLININVNGTSYELAVKPNATLVDVLREQLRLTGTKKGCGLGDCGACTVLLNGKAVNSCLVLAVEADGQNILTIEGLAKGEELHPIQQAFVEKGSIQCGYCTPGMILSAKSLLEENPKPSESEIRMAISGNLCRCGCYTGIARAIQKAVDETSGRRA